MIVVLQKEWFSVNNDLMFSSKKDDWETPPELFQELNKEFGFTLDVCASNVNNKCPNFFTEEDDGLLKDWEGICWCNPPLMVEKLLIGSGRLLWNVLKRRIAKR